MDIHAAGGARVEIGEKGRDPRRPTEQASHVALARRGVAFTERDVPVGVDESSRLPSSVEIECKRHGDLLGVVVDERQPRAQRLPERTVGPPHVVAAGCVGREPQSGASQVPRIRRDDEIAFVLDNSDGANVNLIYRWLRPSATIRRHACFRLAVDPQVVENPPAGAAVERCRLLRRHAGAVRSELSR